MKVTVIVNEIFNLVCAKKSTVSKKKFKKTTYTNLFVNEFKKWIANHTVRLYMLLITTGLKCLIGVQSSCVNIFMNTV